MTFTSLGGGGGKKAIHFPCSNKFPLSLSRAPVVAAKERLAPAHQLQTLHTAHLLPRRHVHPQLPGGGAAHVTDILMNNSCYLERFQNAESWVDASLWTLGVTLRRVEYGVDYVEVVHEVGQQ